jgi:hypothetical protein
MQTSPPTPPLAKGRVREGSVNIADSLSIFQDFSNNLLDYLNPYLNDFLVRCKTHVDARIVSIIA